MNQNGTVDAPGPTAGTPASDDRARLEVDSVSVSFGGVQALDDVSLSVRSGETLGIIGTNGAGKTTLFGAITGFVSVDAGVIRLDGRRISGRPPHRINRAGIGRTFQTMRLFEDMTVVENVMIGALRAHRTIADADAASLHVVELVGLEEKARARAGTLSTGQRKRLELARAAATGAEVLLVDEIFGGLDAVISETIADVLRSLRGGGYTIVLIDHNLELVMELVDRVVVMHAGKVVASGSPEEIVSDRELMATYFE